MRDQILADLSSHLDQTTVASLFESYEELIAKHRSGDLEGALTKGGRFVEHALRLIQAKRTGRVPSEIKSVAASIKELENDATLPEPLRVLIPRVLSGMIYSLRSKRDAVHVKEIDPRSIDVAMAVSAASWVIAELLRMYHVSEEGVVRQTMLALTRTSLPLVEALDGETFVGRSVKATTELLLLLAHASPNGVKRKALGIAAKCSQSAVTKGLQVLETERFVHKSTSGGYFITSAGEAHLAGQLQGGNAFAKRGQIRRTRKRKTAC